MAEKTPDQTTDYPSVQTGVNASSIGCFQCGDDPQRADNVLNVKLQNIQVPLDVCQPIVSFLLIAKFDRGDCNCPD